MTARALLVAAALSIAAPVFASALQPPPPAPAEKPQKTARPTPQPRAARAAAAAARGPAGEREGGSDDHRPARRDRAREENGERRDRRTT